jgi:hypothetical protein
MGLFSREPKAESTISDKDWAELQRRARSADTESMFSRRNVERRLASNEQQAKREQS